MKVGQPQGTTRITRLQHVLRSMRVCYVNNVRAGRCEHDPDALAAFDAKLRNLRNGKTARLLGES